MTLPGGGLPEGPLEAILAWCADDQDRLQVAYDRELKAVEPRKAVVAVLGRRLMEAGYRGRPAPERAG